MSEQNPIGKIVRRCFLDCDLNCAESTLTAALQSVGKPCEPDAVKAVAGFGGGIGGKGETCGALAGNIGAIGILLVEKQAHKSPNMRTVAGTYHDRFLEKFGSIRCADLKPRYFTEQGRCVNLVEQASELFQEVWNEAVSKDK